MKRGFTLIELLVVVLIIGILAAVALPQYEKAVARARSAEVLSQLKTLAQAAEVYALETGSWPASFDVLSVDIPGESETYQSVANAKKMGRYNNCVLTDGRVDCGSNDALRQASFLYVSGYAPAAHRPAPGKHYYCYYNPGNDGKDTVRESLCKSAGGKERYEVSATSIWFPLD